MIGAATFLILWLLVIACDLPTSTQRDLEDRFPWRHARAFGLASSLVEFPMRRCGRRGAADRPRW